MQITQFYKWANKLNRYLFTKDVPNCQHISERCSTSLIIKEMQIKKTIRYHLTLIKIVIILNNNNNDNITILKDKKKRYLF